MPAATESSSAAEPKSGCISSSTTSSGYKWTSPTGPPQRIQQGTLCRVWITTRSRSPISLVLPLLREDQGL